MSRMMRKPIIISSKYNHRISKRNWCTIGKTEYTNEITNTLTNSTSKSTLNGENLPSTKRIFPFIFGFPLVQAEIEQLHFLCMVSGYKNGNSRITWNKVHTRESKWAIFIDWEYPKPMTMTTIISNFAYRVFNSPSFTRMATLFTKTKPYFISHNITTCMFERFSQYLRREILEFTLAR